MFHGILLSNISESVIVARNSGAYRIATELRLSNWDIEVVDFFFLWEESEIKQYLTAQINKHTKFIGFSHLFPEWTEKAENICSWLKDNYPSIVIISGSADFPHLIKSNYIDYHIQGYSEQAVFKLFDYLFSNGPKPEIIEYGNKKIIMANEHYLASPLRNPLILYEDRDFLHPSEWVGIEFSRGCKFRCAYCNFPILGVKGDWTRDISNTELQLKDAYDKYGIKHYYVADETFNDRTEKITKFANLVESLDFLPTFAGFIRPDLIAGRQKDKEELLRMNMIFHNYGVESFNHESAKSIGKPMNPEKIKQGLLDVKDYFEKHGSKIYRGSINLIYGLPHETEKSVWDGYEWLAKNWQGQCFRTTVLQIFKKNKVNFEQKYNISKMTVDFESYGYSEMDYETSSKKNELMHKIDPYLAGFLPKNNGWALPAIYWKTDITNIFEQCFLYKKVLKEKQKKDFKACIFELGFLSSQHSVSDRLKLKHFMEDKDTKKQAQHASSILARQYINNKLSIVY